jgi:hypothetical protein
MTTPTKLVGLAVTLGLAASPAYALPTQAPDNSGTSHAPTGAPYSSDSNPGTANKPNPPGPNASLPSKAKAYGYYCQGQSKKRSDNPDPNMKGTAFSRCVTGMAKLANGQTSTAHGACKDQSRKRSDNPQPNMKGTAYSRCVAGAAKLLRTLRAQNGT